MLMMLNGDGNMILVCFFMNLSYSVREISNCILLNFYYEMGIYICNID